MTSDREPGDAPTALADRATATTEPPTAAPPACDPPATATAAAVGGGQWLARWRGRLRAAAGWLASRGGPPALAFLAGQALCLVAAYRHGYHWLDPQSHVRWDGGIYLDIAKTGYYAAPCAEINPIITRPGATCGNTAWFPLFPYLVLGLAKLTGLSLAAAGVLLTEGCTLAVLVAVWCLLPPVRTSRRVACLALAAVFPAGIFFHATFPMSLSVLLVLVMFALLTRERWWAAGPVGLLAATAYPLTMLLAPVGAAFALLPGGRSVRWRALRAGYLAGLTALGLVGVFTLLWATTGQFDAYLKVQGNYTDGAHNPIASLFTWLRLPTRSVVAEMVLSLALVALALVALARAARTRTASPADWVLAAGFGPLILVVPLVYGVSQSQYRAHTLLLPLVVVLRHLPAPVTAALAVVGAPVAYRLTTLYLHGHLI